MFWHRLFRQFDWWMAISMIALLVFGMAAIYSVALSQPSADFITVKKQIIAIVIAFGLFVAVLLSNYRVLESTHWYVYGAGVLLLIAVLLFGDTIRGTTGWFRLGSFSFQPVEFMKVSLIITLSKFFSTRLQSVLRWKDILISGALAAGPAFLVFIQPDLGSSLMLMGIWFVMMLFARISLKQFLTLFGGFVVMSLLAWTFVLAPYQKDRLLTFVDPSRDPLGSGYNVTQAVIAIGSGQFLGRGLGFGSQSQLRFLPEAETDFVLAVIAEELGFVGLVLVFAAFLFLLWRMGRQALRASDDFSAFLILGVGTIIFLQFFVNAGMNVGLLPVTGITLPFVSYGGSSVLFFILMVGLVESVVIRTSVFGKRDARFLDGVIHST